MPGVPPQLAGAYQSISPRERVNTMAVGDIYQVQVHYNIGSERTMNVLHLVEQIDCLDPVPAETVGNVVYTEWELRVPTILFSGQTNVVLINSRRVFPTAGVPSTLIIGSVGFPAIAGTGAGDPVPSTSAGLISLYTDLNTKNGRGRIYLPGIDVLAQNDGQLTAAALLELSLFAEDLNDDFPAIAPGTGQWHFVVQSRTLGLANEVVTAVAHSNLASQRGRRNFPGLGT